MCENAELAKETAERHRRKRRAGTFCCSPREEGTLDITMASTEVPVTLPTASLLLEGQLPIDRRSTRGDK